MTGRAIETREWKPWPKADENELVRMWKEGATATAIGIELGYTRNAIIGKVHRLKLSARRVGRRKSIVKRAYKPSPRRAPRPKALPAPQSAPPAPKPVVECQSPTIERSAAWRALPGSTPVSVERHVSGCRWPVNSVGADHLYCDNDRATGSSYCPAHKRLSTRQPSVQSEATQA